MWGATRPCHHELCHGGLRPLKQPKKILALINGFCGYYVCEVHHFVYLSQVRCRETEAQELGNLFLDHTEDQRQHNVVAMFPFTSRNSYWDLFGIAAVERGGAFGKGCQWEGSMPSFWEYRLAIARVGYHRVGLPFVLQLLYALNCLSSSTMLWFSGQLLLPYHWTPKPWPKNESLCPSETTQSQLFFCSNRKQTALCTMPSW